MIVVLKSMRTGYTETVELPFARMTDICSLTDYYRDRGFLIIEARDVAVVL